MSPVEPNQAVTPLRTAMEARDVTAVVDAFVPDAVRRAPLSADHALFDVTVPTPGRRPEEHHGITSTKVAELVEHAATHGLRLHIRPTQPISHAPEGDQE